jgi:hypothetical protein
VAVARHARTDLREGARRTKTSVLPKGPRAGQVYCHCLAALPSALYQNDIIARRPLVDWCDYAPLPYSELLSFLSLPSPAQVAHQELMQSLNIVRTPNALYRLALYLDQN